MRDNGKVLTLAEYLRWQGMFWSCEAIAERVEGDWRGKAVITRHPDPETPDHPTQTISITARGYDHDAAVEAALETGLKLAFPQEHRCYMETEE